MMMPLESLPIKGNLTTTNKDLPECRIQEIQSLLDRREGVFSCLLSKSWLHAWNTIPTLKFSEEMFNKLNPDRCRFDFVKVVDETMMRYQEQSLRIEKFSLCITNKYTNAFVKKWLQIAVQSGLKELLLCGHCLVLTPVIFTCKTLETLTVVECQLEELDDHMIKCYSLLNLTLSSVHTNEQTICKLFSNIPMIESITIYLCHGLRNIQVDNLGRLKRLDINNCYTTSATLRGTFECHSLTDLRLEYVHIHKDVSRNLFLNCPLIETLRFIDCMGLRKFHVANMRSLRKLVLSTVDIDQETLHKFLLNFPYIEDLSVRDCIDFTDVKVANIYYLMRFVRYRNVVFEDAPSPCVFYICAAKYLKILKLHNLSVDDESLNKSISGFPILEQLTLFECNLFERIKISCQWLKDFSVKSCYKLLEVNFDTPRLRRLGFKDVMVPTLSFTKTSSTQLEIILNVEIGKHVSCFVKLRDLLMKSCRFGLTIHVSNDDVATKIDLDRLREVITTPVKNVEELSILMIYSNKHGEYSTILDALLSICRPKYARVWWFDSIEMGDFKEFLLRELVRKKGQLITAV